jgi:hypothetical protein
MPVSVTRRHIMVRELQLVKWLQLTLLAVALAAGMPQARAQMTGEFGTDVMVVDSALTATITATGKADREASRVAMEELYRQWRLFRAKNFEVQSGDPLFVPDMENVEARLIAASKLIDNGRLAEARGELQTAEVLLLAVRQRHATTAKPASY